jgi:3'-5' exonuclease
VIVFDIETAAQDEEVLAEQFVPKTKEEFVGAQRWKPETIEAKYAEYLTTALEDFKRRAALDATTGQVLAIGLKSEKSAVILDSVNEEKLLEQFWLKATQCESAGRSLVGHNVFGFDLPFLMRRSWMLDVDFPRLTVVKDTMKTWGCGVYGETISLDRLARALGMDGKTNGITGADFARLWNGEKEEHEQARAYLLNDLDLTWKIASRLGIM